MRLLLVEDDEALRTVTAQRLRREGYAADECGDGIEGMDYAINADYDGLVLDIMLPGMDGLSLLRALRARGYSGGVLLLTARDAVEDRVNGLDSGTDDYQPGRAAPAGRSGNGYLSPHRAAGQSAHLPDGQGIRPAGNASAQRRAGAYAQSALRSRVGRAVLRYQSDAVYIGYLRGKIDKGEKVPYIHTVRGFGYVLREEEPV